MITIDGNINMSQTTNQYVYLEVAYVFQHHLEMSMVYLGTITFNTYMFAPSKC